MSRNGAKVNIDEFIDFMRSHPKTTAISINSREYQSILALKAQRLILPNDYMNYFETISVSVLYGPSYISGLHSQMKNLPSESFRLTHDSSGIWYEDIKPATDPESKPVQVIKMADPIFSGYITLRSSSGVPIPDIAMMKRENIVNRVIKVGFYNNKHQTVVYGTAFLQAEWDESNEDIWKFNTTSQVGTNPLVYRWSDKESANDIEILFEFVSSFKKGTKIVEVSNGWGKIPLTKINVAGKYSIQLFAGTVRNPLPIDATDVHTERKGFFAGLKKTFGNPIKTQLKIVTRAFSGLLDMKKEYIKLLPNFFIINKKLMPFLANYRRHLGELVISEQLQHFKKIDQDLIVSQFNKVIDNPDIVISLISYWDIIL